MRIFELPDLHFDLRWADHIDRCIDAVEAHAEIEPPDVIAIPGDLHNRPLYAADRSGYSRLLSVVRRLRAIAPVVAIEGTPSHDAPGAYAPLEELGLVLLRPGVTYVLRGGAVYTNAERWPAEPGVEFDAILFGIPELDKDAADSLGADERSGDILVAFNRYVDEFLAPSRAAFPDVPAIALLHGVVSDSAREHETDVIKSASSLLLRTEDMARAGIDRWILGDIHTPWESDRISAGYAGFTGVDDNPWGKTGFVPAFNVTEIEEETNEETRRRMEENGLEGFAKVPPRITRIPYGSPPREKIFSPLPSYSADVAYWLESSTDDPDLDPAKNGGHPWSRITFEANKETTRRVTKEQADEAKSLGDLLALMLPDETTPFRKDLADSIDASGSGVFRERSIELLRVKVAGATFFGGGTVELNVGALPNGLNAITGDNGAGKSSLLAFCSPYPVVIGKDTESGRSSAIKEFFSEKSSFIEKVFLVDGEKHKHLLSIRGAHTKSAKVEAYLYINGENVLETTSFDAMLERCEELYGPLDDYLRTYQYVQPQQGGAPSGLMSAGATDLRNVVQNIAGIDRSSERRSALDSVAEYDAAVSGLAAKIEAAGEYADDPDPLKRERAALLEKVPEIEKMIEAALEDSSAAGEALKKSEAVLASVLESNQKADEIKQDLEAARAKLAEADRRLEKLEELDPAEAKREIEKDEQAAAEILAWQELVAATRGRNAEAADVYRRAYQRHTQLISAADEKRREHETAVRLFEESVAKAKENAENYKDSAAKLRELGEALADPCESCGYVSEKNKAARDEKNAAADRLIEQADKTLMIADELKPPVPFVPDEIPAEPVAPVPEKDPPRPAAVRLPDDTKRYYLSIISEASKAEALIPEIRERREELAAKVSALSREQIEFEDPEPARIDVAKRKTVLAAKEDSWKALVSEQARFKAEAEELSRRIEVAEEREKELAETKEEFESAKMLLEDWRWIAAALAPARLPAFELELVLDSIDARATENIRPFRESRYSIRTETQREGADGRVDKFQIVIHDAETGEERSFLKHSPGEKAFVSLAYQRALIATREERTGVRYSPHILDEADGPVQPDRVPEYYAMQADTVGNGKALIVSHAPDARHYIGNAVDIEELKG